MMFILLGEPFRQSPVIKYPKSEKGLSKRLMELFGRFVHQETLKRWPKYEINDKTTLKIENGRLRTVKSHYHRENFCNFWRENNVIL